MSIKSKTNSTRMFVRRHKTAITITTTATVTAVLCLKLNALALKQHNDFLKDKGLYEEFYTPEDSYDE